MRGRLGLNQACAPSAEDEKSGRLEPGKEGEVVGDDRGPDVGLEVVEPAPDAARQTIGALQTRDVGFDAGSEVAQVAVDQLLLTMSLMRRPAFLWKAMSWTPRAFAWARLSRLAKPPSAAACRGDSP